jgi:hypothetical protein
MEAITAMLNGRIPVTLAQHCRGSHNYKGVRAHTGLVYFSRLDEKKCKKELKKSQ